MSNNHMKGNLGRSAQCISPDNLAKTVLTAKLESKRLGRRPHAVSFGHKKNILTKVSEGDGDHEYCFALVDYKDNSKIIKKFVMSYLEAHKKNNVLKDLGIAWARIDS
jgi:hypothetical protein